MAIERPRLLRTRFVGKDFDTIFDDMVERAKLEFPGIFNNFVESEPGVFFMDLIAYALGQLSFYLDRQTGEVYIDTAVFRENIGRIARQLGYKPGRATSATTDLQVSLEEAYPFDVKLEVGFQMKSQSGVIFEVQNEVIWTAGDTSAKTVTVSQGVTTRAVFVSDGTPNQRFALPGFTEGTYFVGQTAVVTVAGDVWDEEELLKVELIDQYEIEYDEDPPNLRFGDGVTAGNVPELGDEIRISFRIGIGFEGNVNSGAIDDVVVPLIVLGNTIGLVISQPDKATGGDFPETIASIKANAPRFFASRGVAVTKDDYKALASAFNDPQYGRPAKATAINVRSSELDTTLQLLLSAVEAIFNSLQASIQTEVGAGQASLVTVAAELENINTEAAGLGDDSTTAATAQATVDGAQLLISNDLATVQAKLANIDDKADDIVLENCSPTTVSLANEIKTLAAELIVLAGTISTSNDTLGGASSDLEALAATLTTRQSNIGGAYSTASTETTNAQGNLNTIESLLFVQDTAFNAALKAVEDHVNEELASACKANVVNVPILTKDADGFYVGPPQGLIRALEASLNLVKDVTHSVFVVSAEDRLVAAEVTISVVIEENFVVSAVLGQVEAIVTELLKDREFDDDLTLQQVYDVKDLVDGAKQLNVTLGPAVNLDGGGNLVTNEDQVITRGFVNVTEAS